MGIQLVQSVNNMIPLKLKKTRKKQKVLSPQFSVPSEAAEQITLMDWAKVTKFEFYHHDGRSYEDRFISEFLFAIPNGGSRNVLEAKRLKMQGVMPGVCDLEFMVPCGGYTGMFLEMKRNSKKATVSSLQDDFILKAKACGRHCVVGYGFEQAKEAILSYLEIGIIYRIEDKKYANKSTSNHPSKHY